MDARRALALARAVELVAASMKTAAEMYVRETADLDELDRSVKRHPAGKSPDRIRPLRPEEDR